MQLDWGTRTSRDPCDAAREAEGGADVGQKLAVIRRAVGHEFPTADIEAMLEETERGYRADSGS